MAIGTMATGGIANPLFTVGKAALIGEAAVAAAGTSIGIAAAAAGVGVYDEWKHPDGVVYDEKGKVVDYTTSAKIGAWMTGSELTPVSELSAQAETPIAQLKQQLEANANDEGKQLELLTAFFATTQGKEILKAKGLPEDINAFIAQITKELDAGKSPDEIFKHFFPMASGSPSSPSPQGNGRSSKQGGKPPKGDGCLVQILKFLAFSVAPAGVGLYVGNKRGRIVQEQYDSEQYIKPLETQNAELRKENSELELKALFTQNRLNYQYLTSKNYEKPGLLNENVLASLGKANKDAERNVGKLQMLNKAFLLLALQANLNYVINKKGVEMPMQKLKNAAGKDVDFSTALNDQLGSSFANVDTNVTGVTNLQGHQKLLATTNRELSTLLNSLGIQQ